MFNEAELSAIYVRNPFLRGYLSTMLQDLQMSEADEAATDDRDERDAGTIYTIPAETFGRALADCEGFMRTANEKGALDAAAERMGMEALGSDFHLTRVGHGAGYWDRSPLCCAGGKVANIGAALTEAAHLYRNEGGYFGDDGRVYL